MTKEKSRETRIRNALARQGYTLSKSRRRDPKALDFGRYTITSGTGEGVFSADDLGEVEKWVAAEDAVRKSTPVRHATVTAEQYGEVCDAVERTFHGWPLTDDSGMLHTSREARAAANRILEILGLEVQA